MPAPSHRPAPRFYAFGDDVVEVALHEPSARERVPEAFVQSLWEAARFDASALATVQGEAVRIVDPGRLNTDAGPDFLDAHVRLGDVAWRGSVEVHVTSGGWIDHAHERDAAYDGVVLHVTLYADVWTGKLRCSDGRLLPELVLLPYLERPVRELLYRYYTRPAERAMPCAGQWADVPAQLRTAWVTALAEERLRERTAAVEAELRADDVPLDEVLWRRLLAGLGYAKNGEAMHALARRVPLRLARRLDDPRDLEALLLGTAGLVPGPAELLEADRATADHAVDLADRFDALRHRFDLEPMPRTRWRFARLRPANQPPLRLAQAAGWLCPGGLLRGDAVARLRAAATDAEAVVALRDVLAVEAAPFWATHVRLDRACRPHSPAVGRNRLDTLVADAVVPVLACDAHRRDDAEAGAAARRLLAALPAGRDEVTRRFAALGSRPQSAAEAQGLYQLFHTRCASFRCLSCRIGRHLLRA